MSKEEAKKELIKLVELYKEGQKYWDTKSESDIGFHLIEPLFEKVLGWDKLSITKEERVLNKRADYIIKLANEDVLVVEAKKTLISLNEEEGRQVVSYAYHKKAKFAVLTNFKNLIVYHALSNIKNVIKNQLKIGNSFFRLNFEEIIDKFDVLWLLSKESFEKKEINKLLSAKDEKLYKPIDKHILEDLLKIREWLSKELKSKKPYLEGQIDEIVQILIDRLIFIRSVEDRGLENKNYLKIVEAKVRNQDVSLQLFPYLIEEFKRFNKNYDSHLFETGLLEKEGAFSDEVLRKVILALYSGTEGLQEDYQFDKIPGDLFGGIYEQYLGTILQTTEKRVKLEGGSGKKKKMGIYYTPSYIVDYIVKNTVGEYIKNRTIDEILEIKIVDPACGSGSFLTRAFKEICNEIEKRLNSGEKSNKYQGFQSLSKRLNLSQKATILKGCIYGVDLDEKAVELAQLNLLLKILEDEDSSLPNKRLPNLLSNVKNGNSLIDDSKIAGDKAFKWEAQFPEVFRNGGFDVVIGNPPYFKIKEQDPIKKLEIYNEIKSGMMNISAVFINKALEITRSGGYIGMIVPKMLAFTESWAKIRKKVLSITSLKNVVDAGKAFEDVLLEQIIFCLKKEKETNNKIRIGSIEDNKNILETTLIEQFLCLKDNKIYLEPEKLAYSIKEKMEKGNLKLGEIAEVFLGLGIQGMDNFVDKPKSNYKKALGGNGIQRWNIRGFWYYNPNDKELQKYKNQFQKFFRPKIVVQRIVAHIRDHIKITAAYDEEGLFTFNTVTNIIVNDKNYTSELLLILLNSKIIQHYVYKFIYQNAIRSMDFYEAYAKQIPIPKIDKKTQEKLITLVSQLINLKRQFYEKNLSGNEKERLEQQIKNIDYEIDQEVYKLYGLTKEEINIIEESLK